MWWSCHAIVAKDGLVTFYVDGFAQLKLKFRPRVGSQVNMFEVVDSWSGKVETVWADWRPGKIYGLDDLLAALNETRRIANGQWENWDDVNKVFIPNSDGNGLSARCE